MNRERPEENADAPGSGWASSQWDVNFWVEWTHHCLFQLTSHKPGFCYNPHWVNCNLAPNAVCSFSPLFNDSDIYSFLFPQRIQTTIQIIFNRMGWKSVTKTPIWKTYYHDPRKAASVQLPVNDTGTNDKLNPMTNLVLILRIGQGQMWIGINKMIYSINFKGFQHVRE